MKAGHPRRLSCQRSPNQEIAWFEKSKRVAMITGGNSGIGFAAASKLAAREFHVLCCHTQPGRAQRTGHRARALVDNPGASLK